MLRVLLVVFRLSGYSLNQSHLPDGKEKRSLLRVVERSRSVLPLRRMVRFIHLSPSRYHAWIRLLDGSRAYLHAVIDNFSRRILSWKVNDRFDLATTVEILLTASQGAFNEKPLLLADAGVKNVNGAVNELIDSGLLNRVLAQTEIALSNSLIESWWRVLKHQWLYLNTLDTVRTVEKLVAFYVQEHNSRLPHSAFAGQTPDEKYFGTGDGIPQQLQPLDGVRGKLERKPIGNGPAAHVGCKP